ncbi:hypothetical protein RvY_14934 [Ramazzottius varieornatus]|uniref:Uncharacterized protein n=1 Tax=Ramazzottius varieornatus TaxID=947166 RepID=A0A1D1VT07_RAMVA|nr:hypothetical protein RvY_14934 [Ramazzottius varieornatus]
MESLTDLLDALRTSLSNALSRLANSATHCDDGLDDRSNRIGNLFGTACFRLGPDGAPAGMPFVPLAPGTQPPCTTYGGVQNNHIQH